MKHLILLLALCATLDAQDTAYGYRAKANTPVEFQNASHTRPMRVGTTLPVDCTEVGELFFDSDAPAGSNIYGLTGTGPCAWTLMSGGGGGSGSGEYTGTIDFGPIPDGSCVSGTYAGAGAVTGLILAEGLPAGLNTGVSVRLWISAADTVKGEACNKSGAQVDPTTLTFKVKTVNGYLSGSSTVNFDEISDLGCNTQTLTVTGAATGDHVALGIPAALDTGIHIENAIVTSANTVSITACNYRGAAFNPTEMTFSAAIIK